MTADRRGAAGWPVVYTIIRKLGKWINRMSRSALEAGVSYHTANEVLSGLRVVKATPLRIANRAFRRREPGAVVEQGSRCGRPGALSSPLVETVTLIVLSALAGR